MNLRRPLSVDRYNVDEWAAVAAAADDDDETVSRYCPVAATAAVDVVA